MKVIEITEQNAKNISGTSKAGKSYSFDVQKAYLHSGDTYPKEFEITLPDGNGPFPVGNYNLSDDSIYVDRNGRLAINARLVRAK